MTIPWSKSAIDAACGSIKTITMMLGQTGSAADQAIMTAARLGELEAGGRGERYLQHYLEGSGRDMIFSLKQLLNEDLGVRRRLFQRVNREIDTAMVKSKELPSTLVSKCPIPQSYYAVSDWKNALGGIIIDWRLMGYRDDKNAPYFIVDISCVNIYQWHPDVLRRSQCVHQAAVRLQNPKPNDHLTTNLLAASAGSTGMANPINHVVEQIKKARNFRMVSPIETVYIPKLYTCTGEVDNSSDL